MGTISNYVVCPNCGYQNTKVKNTTHGRHGDLRRQRLCLRCAKIFTMYEVHADVYKLLRLLHKFLQKEHS